MAVFIFEPYHYRRVKIMYAVKGLRRFPVSAQLKYIRIPFKEHGRDFDGCDCGGLVWLVYKNELGIELPDWRGYYQNTQIESFDELSWTVDTMLGGIGKEVPKDEGVKPFDVISLKIAGHPIHVGVAVDSNRFLHIMEGDTNVRQERLDGMSWRRRIDGVFRYPGLV